MYLFLCGCFSTSRIGANYRRRINAAGELTRGEVLKEYQPEFQRLHFP